MKRVCVLTGASGLLGVEFSKRFANIYHIVAVHHRNPLSHPTQDQVLFDPLSPNDAIDANNHALFSIRANIQREEDINRIIRSVMLRFGCIDILINCAAVRSFSNFLSPQGILKSERVFAINVLAPLRLSVGFANAYWNQNPDSNRQNNRHIINISSTAGLVVYPNLGQGLYAASKAALNTLTCHLASEFKAIGIRVNAVAPDTFPGRVSIDEVLNAIMSLDTSDCTGQIVAQYYPKDVKQPL